MNSTASPPTKKKWRFKLPRFTLRWMFALTALVAIALAFVTNELRWFRLEMVACEEIPKFGTYTSCMCGYEQYGKTSYEPEFRWKDLRQGRLYRPIEEVGLGGLKLDRPMWKQVRAFRFLKELQLEDCRITTSAVDFSALTALERLDFDSMTLTEKHVSQICRLKQLKELWIADSELPGPHWTAGLAELKELESLMLHRVDFDDEVLVPLQQLTSLTFLVLDGNRLSANAVLPLARLRKLYFLALRETGIQEAGLKDLPLLTQLEHLDLEEPGVTDATLVTVGKLSHLTQLSLQGASITDAGIAHLVNLPKLEAINLRGTQVTPAMLPLLYQIKSLQWHRVWVDFYPVPPPPNRP